MVDKFDITHNDVTILIDGNRWRFFHDLEIQLAVDQFSTVTFTSPFEADRALFRSTFRPFSYKPLSILVNGQALLTGTLVGVEPKIESGSKTVACAGYSLPSVLQDANAPASNFPLEFHNLTLLQIAQQLAKKFSITVRSDQSTGAAFRKVKLHPEQKIHEFLADLARQRGLVITDAPDGSLVFLTSIGKGAPIARFKEGQSPLRSVSGTFSPQSYYSEITGIAKAKSGRIGSRFTATNSRLQSVVRPNTFELEETEKGDLPGAVAAKIARMFGNMISYVVEVDTWQDPNGNLWKPNTLVTLYAPDCMIYKEVTFLIRNVVFRQQENSFAASLGLVLPGVFSSEIPQVLPWDS